MPPAGAALPKVAVIGTGGTISSVGRDSLDLVDYTATGKALHNLWWAATTRPRQRPLSTDRLIVESSKHLLE